MADIFQQLHKDLEDSLRDAGLREYPRMEEPAPLGRLRQLSDEDIQNVLDDHRVYYRYINASLTKVLTFVRAAEARAKYVEAAVTADVSSNHTFKNQEQRKAAIALNNAVVSSRNEYIKYKSLREMLELRLEAVQREMEQYGYELHRRGVHRSLQARTDGVKQPAPEPRGVWVEAAKTVVNNAAARAAVKEKEEEPRLPKVILRNTETAPKAEPAAERDLVDLTVDRLASLSRRAIKPKQAPIIPRRGRGHTDDRD